MTEWRVQVVELGKVGKHPNADTLSITQVNGAYPVIFKTGELVQGSRAIHVPPDSLVPVDRPEFSWLADKAVNGYHRVRFCKLRGIPSYGFLLPMPDGWHFLEPGDLVHEQLGVKHYDPGPCYEMGDQGECVRVSCEAMIPHYDIEGLRKYETLFQPGEEVWITEKIHGTNARYIFIDGQLYCGSRTKFRANSVWNKIGEKYNLSDILSRHPGLVLFGEIYGPTIQDLTYGRSEPDFAAFDLYDTVTGRYLDKLQFQRFCMLYDLPMVPTLAQAPFNLEDCYKMAEGKSLICHTQVREGIVVKPVSERMDQHMGRVILKLPGEGYLLRKEEK
jgi:RNA ligase (TIGR02306 family)